MIVAALTDFDALNFEALKALFLSRHEQYLEAISAQDEEIDRARLVVEKLKRLLFGAKSEKVSAQLQQLEFQLEELETAHAADEAIVERSIPGTVPRIKPFRKPLPAHLPREVITHLPEHDCCPGCGGALNQFGEDVAEQLERIPATFKIIRHVRPKFACARCERVVEAPAPMRPIERGLAGPGLLSHVLVAKYGEHQPLYRQSEIYAREGVDLDRSTLAGWVGATSELLTPLVHSVRNYVLAATKIHADDTPVPVLAPGNGKTKTGRLWTYVRDDRPAGDTSAAAVWFATRPIARANIRSST